MTSVLQNKSVNAFLGTFHGCQMKLYDFVTVMTIIALVMQWIDFHQKNVNVCQIAKQLHLVFLNQNLGWKIQANVFLENSNIYF